MKTKARSAMSTLRTLCLGAIVTAGLAIGGALAQAPPRPALKADVDAFPTSRSLLAASQAIINSGQDEASLRARSGLVQLSTFRLGGETVALLGSGDTAIPRLAIAPEQGGVGFLIRLPVLPKGVGYQNRSGDPVYAVATIQKRTVSIWGYLDALPPDGGLSKRILKAFAHLEAPLSTFELPARAG